MRAPCFESTRGFHGLVEMILNFVSAESHGIFECWTAFVTIMAHTFVRFLLHLEIFTICQFTSIKLDEFWNFWTENLYVLFQNFQDWLPWLDGFVIFYQESGQNQFEVRDIYHLTETNCAWTWFKRFNSLLVTIVPENQIFVGNIILILKKNLQS